MIPSVQFQAGGSHYSMRLTTRAIMNIEAAFECGITDVLERVQTEASVSNAVIMIAAAMADGKGIEIEKAADLADEVGIPFLMEKFGEAVEAAFPAAKKTESAGKAA